MQKLKEDWARVFYFGHGVAKNRQEAIRWYRLAAEQGNSVAISMLKKLGVM